MRWQCTRFVLVVDSDDNFREAVQEVLEFTDYIILHANSGQEAVALLTQLRPSVDLVVIDLELPDERDLGVCALLTTAGCLNAAKVIARTSRKGESFLRQVRCLGVDVILSKPTSAEQLVDTVHAVLSGPK
jgi:CheY-like chemotaxis protein